MKHCVTAKASDVTHCAGCSEFRVVPFCLWWRDYLRQPSAVWKVAFAGYLLGGDFCWAYATVTERFFKVCFRSQGLVLCPVDYERSMIKTELKYNQVYISYTIQISFLQVGGDWSQGCGWKVTQDASLLFTTLLRSSWNHLKSGHRTRMCKWVARSMSLPVTE